MSTTPASAPDATSSKAGNVGHSACPAAVARSCSWTSQARITAASCGAIAAAAQRFTSGISTFPAGGRGSRDGRAIEVVGAAHGLCPCKS